MNVVDLCKRWTSRPKVKSLRHTFFSWHIISSEWKQRVSSLPHLSLCLFIFNLILGEGYTLRLAWPLEKCWSYPNFCSQSGLSLEFSVAASANYRTALKVNSSLPVDFVMSSSWTAGLVCVTGYFQWSQCDCTVCLCCSVRSQWNGQMCHRCLVEDVRPRLFGLVCARYLVCVVACSCALFGRVVWVVLFHLWLHPRGHIEPTVINVTALHSPHGNLKLSAVRWQGDNSALSPVWLTSIRDSHVKLWLQGRCL